MQMQKQYVGTVGDLGKLALLRQLMEGRQLAVCWYLTGDELDDTLPRRYFNYLDRPGDFRNLAPEVFDALKDIVEDPLVQCPIGALRATGILGNALFHGKPVPKRARLRHDWAHELVQSVNAADMVFLDPNNGIQGTRLTPDHVALAELAALRRQDRVLVVAQRQSGRRSDARFLRDRLRSLHCERIELIRLRLGFSRFYVVADHDEEMSKRIAAFAKKWGSLVKTYRL
jgi:hypothetical protein